MLLLTKLQNTLFGASYAYFWPNPLMSMMENIIPARTRRPLDRQLRVLIFANVLFCFFAILLTIWALRQVQSCGNVDIQNPLDRSLLNNSQTTFSSVWNVLKCWWKEDPLKNIAKYSLQRFDAELGAPSVFKGPPRKELDDAWHALVDR